MESEYVFLLTLLSLRSVCAVLHIGQQAFFVCKYDFCDLRKRIAASNGVGGARPPRPWLASKVIRDLIIFIRVKICTLGKCHGFILNCSAVTNVKSIYVSLNH